MHVLIWYNKIRHDYVIRREFLNKNCGGVLQAHKESPIIGLKINFFLND